MTKLRNWFLWYTQNCDFGLKVFSLGPRVQNRLFVVGLVQNCLGTLNMTKLPLIIYFFIFFIEFTIFLIKKKRKKNAFHLSLSLSLYLALPQSGNQGIVP